MSSTSWSGAACRSAASSRATSSSRTSPRPATGRSPARCSSTSSTGPGSRSRGSPAVMPRFPQVLRNVRGRRPERLDGDGKFWAAASEAQAELGDDGPGPGPPVRHRAARAGHGGGADRGAGAACRRPSGRGRRSGLRSGRDRPIVGWLAMCGIVGVVRRPSRREPPDGQLLVAELDAARDASRHSTPARSTTRPRSSRVSTGPAGCPRCPGPPRRPGRARPHRAHRRASSRQRLLGLEADLDAGTVSVSPAELEALNAALVRCKDAVWAVSADRLRTARAVADLAGEASGSVAALEAFTSVQVALSALDRLEVRGRDSAGLAPARPWSRARPRRSDARSPDR